MRRRVKFAETLFSSPGSLLSDPKLVEDSSLRNRTYVFRDRDEAGTRLAEKLEKYRSENPLVLAIPKGGIPVGLAVAKRLRASFDLIVSRKIPLPYTREAGFGALTWDGIMVLNQELISAASLNKRDIDHGIKVALEELEEATRSLRGGRPPPTVKDKLIILVDDGLASGYTMKAAIKYVRKHGARRVVVAVPTTSSSALSLILPELDELVCLNVRDLYPYAVADAYVEWHDVSEQEARSYLRSLADN